MERGQSVKARILKLRHDLGPAGVAGLVLLAAAALFMLLVLQPLEERARDVQTRAAGRTAAAAPQSGATGEKVAELYRYLDKPEETTDWLAKLYAIGKATGVELQSASYKLQAGGGRIERYEIVVPVSGSYPQMRDFLKRSLAEIPVLSLDQMSLKRESRNDGMLQAELRLTLHKVKS